MEFFLTIFSEWSRPSPNLSLVSDHITFTLRWILLRVHWTWLWKQWCLAPPVAFFLFLLNLKLWYSFVHHFSRSKKKGYKKERKKNEGKRKRKWGQKKKSFREFFSMEKNSWTKKKYTKLEKIFSTDLLSTWNSIFLSLSIFCSRSQHSTDVHPGKMSSFRRQFKTLME